MPKKKTTQEFKDAFVDLLGHIPNLTIAGRLLNVAPSNIIKARKADKTFNDAVLAAIDRGYDTIEEEARRRAVDGVLEPVFYKGEEVGEVRKYSDFLLGKLLKAYKPKKFNPGAKFDFGKGQKVTMTFNLEGDADED